MLIEIEPHPRLRAVAFLTELPAPLAELTPPAGLVALLTAAGPAPLQRDEAVRTAVRDMLRLGGYKPTGRGKPASEYLVRAVAEGTLASINLAVDACNAVSLHSGLPISVVDADRAVPPWRIATAGAGARYVFNATGQEIDLEGLLCLFDAAGPCANPVRDAQRTKTSGATVRTLSIVWGCAPHAERVDAAVTWYRGLLAEAGAATNVLVGQVLPA